MRSFGAHVAIIVASAQTLPLTKVASLEGVFRVARVFDARLNDIF
jgi:hypothetical protein